jgi:hypothetical protein
MSCRAGQWKYGNIAKSGAKHQKSNDPKELYFQKEDGFLWFEWSNIQSSPGTRTLP